MSIAQSYKNKDISTLMNISLYTQTIKKKDIAQQMHKNNKTTKQNMILFPYLEQNEDNKEKNRPYS